MTEQIAIQAKIRSYFIELQTKNPAFSLRAFAKKLQLSPSAISEILNGKRKISEKMAHKIMDRMILNPEELDEIKNLFKAQKAKKDLQEPRSNVLFNYKKHLDYIKLTNDQFSVISEWQHLALLVLMETEDFQHDYSWMSKRLGLTALEVEKAMTRLIGLNLVVYQDQKFTKSNTPMTSSDDVSNKAVRKSHYEDLKLAEKSLDDCPLELRDFTAITIAVDQSKMVEAKKMIREFQDRLAQFLEDGQKTEVYKITTYLYPLTNVAGDKKTDQPMDSLDQPPNQLRSQNQQGDSNEKS